MTVEVDGPAFSFGELLVLLDVDGVGAMSSPLPTVAEASVLAPGEVRGTAPCVEFHGACRFRTGLAHLYDPPHTELVVGPAHVMLSITRFADVDIWTNMFEWVSSYLGDTLTVTPRGAAAAGVGEYAGPGVIATLRYTRPDVRHDSRDLRLEVGLRRDEPALATVRRLLGLAADVTIAPQDDGNWRELASAWPVHLECSRHGDTVRFRFSSPHHDGETSCANLCEQWCWRWLDLCAGEGAGPTHHDRVQVAWDLDGLGHVSIVRGDGAHRRDVHELHVPVAWLEGGAAAR
ncbi:MAG: hypothetical protein H6709_18795 [Kofleriaceae bacterium]|nr:hypothetical protein [Myxococcales bacterium]MCB9564807.1 hypothetical protein [Kofleriaceae bacterium]MCB9574137.1 hypothetical protein [Kofleriaceae bacterium]